MKREPVRTVGDVVRGSANAARWLDAFRAMRVDVESTDEESGELFACPVDCTVGHACVAVVGAVDAILLHGADDERDTFIEGAVRQCCVWCYG